MLGFKIPRKPSENTRGIQVYRFWQMVQISVKHLNIKIHYTNLKNVKIFTITKTQEQIVVQ